MISLLRRHRKSLFIAITAVFLIGIFVGLGGYLFTSRDTLGAVAQVGSVKIPYLHYLRRVDQYLDALRERGTEVTDAVAKEVKQEMFRDLIVEELLLVKSDEMGIVVTDEELSRDIRNTPAFGRDGAFDQAVYAAAVRRVYRDTPQGYEETRRKSLKTAKLKALIFQAAKLTPAELREAYASEHKGSLDGFDKERQDFEARLQQARAIDLINFYLRQVSTQVEIRSFLAEREAGA